MPTTAAPKTKLATVTGTFLKPGVSKNRRLYTRENIAAAVTTMDARLRRPDGYPITSFTSHGAAGADDTTQIVGRLTGVAFDSKTGNATYEAEIADTAVGRDLVAQITPDDQGRQYLKGVSIRGYWNGPVESKLVDGVQVQTADDLEIEGIDFTARPGVEGASVEKVLLEATEEAAGGRKIIVEHVDDAGSLIPAPVEAAPTPVTPDGTDYADPGWQKDKKPRYPLNSKARALSAWGYINKQVNADKYTGTQLKKIKSKIQAALKKFKVKAAAEGFDLAGETLAALIEEASASMSIDHGQGSVHVSGYTGYDGNPVDMPTMASKVAQAALAAHHALDPNADGVVDDMDDGDADDQPCAECGEDVPEESNFCPNCGAKANTEESNQAGAAGLTESEHAVPEANSTTTPAAPAATTPTTEAVPAGTDAPTFTQAQVDEAVAAAVAAAKTATTEASESKTVEERIVEMKAEFDAKLEESEAKFDAARKEIIESSGPKRKGLVAEAMLKEREITTESLAKMGDEEWEQVKQSVFADIIPDPRRF